MEQEGWAMVTDIKQMEAVCREVIAANEKTVISGNVQLVRSCKFIKLHLFEQVTMYRSGKKKAFTKLAAMVQQKSNNKFDMSVATDILRRILDEK